MNDKFEFANVVLDADVNRDGMGMKHFGVMIHHYLTGELFIKMDNQFIIWRKPIHVMSKQVYQVHWIPKA